ncbi:MAG: hypothetical protein APF78_05075 [Sphingomonadales bacterium BRH_c3]|nr:MAG: hypothetical protein APF78_05075 [Sphingomonadales bacterium BRH_c3]
MIWRAAFAALAALVLAGCQQDNAPIDDGSQASPLLYRVSVGSGEPQAWLFGTIHSLPSRTQWRTPELETAIADAGMLMVEIAALENEPGIRAIYSRLATTPGQPDVGLKVPASHRPRLFSMIHESGFTPGEMSGTETWAVALLLAQLGDTGESANGADRAIIREFLGREIAEFEGAEKQLGIFDSLPESEQRDLLTGVIDDFDRHRKDPGELRRAWLAGDEAALVKATESGILADPELRAALLTDRNRDWIGQLLPEIERGRKPMVAVGAAHLVGPDGLAAMLRQRGYKVTRVQ